MILLISEYTGHQDVDSKAYLRATSIQNTAFAILFSSGADPFNYIFFSFLPNEKYSWIVTQL